MAQLYNWSADFKPRKSANIGEACYGVDDVIAETKVLASAEAIKELERQGQKAANYFLPKLTRRGKAERPDESATPAAGDGDRAQPVTEGSDGQQAGVTDSVDDSQPGQHEQLDKLYGGNGEDPAPADEPGDLPPEVGQGSEQPGAGPNQTVAEVADTELEQLNKMILSLPAGERLRIEGVPAERYHKSVGYGSSAVKTVIEYCPGMLRAEMDGEIERDEDNYVLGSASHDRLLLPDVFESDYVIQPKEIEVPGEAKPLPINKRDLRSRAWQACLAKYPDKVILTQKQYDAAQAMRKTFLAAFKRYFTGGTPEVSYWYRDPETRLILKARVDYEKGRLGCDVKTIGMWPSPDNVDRQFKNLLYYVQENHYLRVTGLARYPFFFVSTKKPHPTLGPRDSSDELAALGELECQAAYKLLKHCEEVNDWPWWEHNYTQVEPGYAERKRLEELRKGTKK